MPNHEVEKPNEHTTGLLCLMSMLGLYIVLILLLDGSRVSRSLISAALVLTAAGWGLLNARRSEFLLQALGAKPRWRATIVFTIITFVLVRLAGYGFAAAFPAQAISLRHDVVSWPFLAFYFLVSIPLQEFVFRGYALTALERWTKNWVAPVIISSGIYAFFHLHYGWKLALAVFPLGLLFGYIKHHTHSLVYATITHAIVALVFYYLI